jgi:hypothetical protein
MAVTITDNRTVVDEADATTDWTASAGVAVFTAAPDPVEATGSLGTQVSLATENSYHTLAASDDISNACVYAWLLPGGVLETTVAGGIQVYLGDGTNDRGYHIGGSNGAGFRHDDGPVVWQCFAIDTGSLPANFTNFVGAGAPNFAAITRVGNVFTTLAKSVGGQENCFIDIAYYGNGGLTITGGGAGTEGKFLEIAVRDRSTADHPGTGVASAAGGAYGAVRELGAALFGIQTRMQFGDDVGTLSVDFEDTSQTFVFEDRGFGVDKYGVTITGNATGTTSFVLGTRDGVGIGSAGCSLVTPIGVGAFFTASSANIDTIGLYACTLSGFDQGFTFTTDATAGAGHEIFSTSFTGCAQIQIGQTEFINNQISSTVATGITAGAVLIEDTATVSDLAFTSGGTGHAIVINSATNSPFDFTNFTYNGYAAVDGGTGNEVLVNRSGATITINVSGGDAPTVDTTNSNGTVIINNNVTVTITVVDTTTAPIVGAVVGVYNSTTNVELVNDETNGSGIVTFSTAGSQPVYIRALKSTTGSTRYIPVETTGNTGAGLSLTVTLNEDGIVDP